MARCVGRLRKLEAERGREVLAGLLLFAIVAACGPRAAGMKLPSHKDLNAYPAGVQTARLVDDGGCVFAESTVGSQRWLAIWPMGFVLDGQELRSDGRLVASIGEMVNLGGGEYKAAQFDFVQTLLDEPVPPVCRGGDYWLVTGIVK